MPSTHFETTVSATRIIVDEPALARCDLGHWPLVAAILAAIAVVLVVLKPTRWHLFAGGGIVLAAFAMSAGVSRFFVAQPNGDESGVLAIVKDIRFPYEELFAMDALAMVALALGVMTVVVKKDLGLRIAACVVMPLAIALLVQSAMCARAIRVAIGNLESIRPVPHIDASDWPDGVHVGEPFAIHAVLTPVVPGTGGFLGLGRRWVDVHDWSVLNVYTAHETGTVRVTLTAMRGPVRVEHDKDLVVERDEGPSWLPLALGNTWTLIEARGKPERVGAIEEIFTKNTPSPKAAKKILRVDREVHEAGLHKFVLKLTDVDGTTREAKVHRRNGELVGEDGTSLDPGVFPLLHTCRYATAPIDTARTLGGPTVCGATTKHEPYGDVHGVGLALAIISLGAIDSRPTHLVEEGFVLARSGVE